MRIRPATLADMEATFRVRATTCENAVSRERLAELGVTPESETEALLGGSYRSWVCEIQGSVVAFCNADAGNGEVVVLAVQAGHEGHGIGKALLAEAVAYLRGRGCQQPWLMASPRTDLRSHGFYRRNGWQPSGRHDARGDEELVYSPPSPG